MDSTIRTAGNLITASDAEPDLVERQQRHGFRSDELDPNAVVIDAGRAETRGPK